MIKRRVLLSASALGAARLALGADETRKSVSAAFPSHDVEAAREFVTVAHGNLARVKELVEKRPALAKTSFDWGFGDWETALGAASHIGHRPIAELLIANGAPPTIFSATMLGQLEIVKAFVVASPGIQRQHGPHGITLLAHARAGGAAAKPVLEYLQTLGDAGEPVENLPLSEPEKEAILGTYSFGETPADRFEVAASRSGLTIQRTTGIARGLSHRGGLSFSPAGAASVRIRFEVENGKAKALSVLDPDLVVRAVRL